jgi:predicted Fe-Mo cluster-binding NifX family protein
MKIAISAESNQGLGSPIARHFGHSPFFVLVDVEEGQVKSTQSVANPFALEHQPGQIPAFLKKQGAEVVLSGGIGARAIQYFTAAGIQTATGADGTVRQSLENYLVGSFPASAPCDESVSHGHSHGHAHGHG